MKVYCDSGDSPVGEPIVVPDLQEDDDFIPGPLDEEEAEAFEDHTTEEDEIQDRDDDDPSAPLKPPFDKIQ